jgi:hypothetical protein
MPRGVMVMVRNYHVLWRADGKYVPVTYYANTYINTAELFIVEEIRLVYDDDTDYKRIKLVGRRVKFVDNGAVPAKVGSIVAGWVHVDLAVGHREDLRIYGYVHEGSSFDWQSSYGKLSIKNVSNIGCPCSYHPFFAEEFIKCIMDYYTSFLNMGVDIEDVEKEYVPGGELERAICVLILASIKEVLDILIKNMSGEGSQGGVNG